MKQGLLKYKKRLFRGLHNGHHDDDNDGSDNDTNDDAHLQLRWV